MHTVLDPYEGVHSTLADVFHGMHPGDTFSLSTRGDDRVLWGTHWRSPFTVTKYRPSDSLAYDVFYLVVAITHQEFCRDGVGQVNFELKKLTVIANDRIKEFTV